jgi:hypothetical protein
VLFALYQGQKRGGSSAAVPRTDVQSFRICVLVSPEVKDLGVEDPAKNQTGFNPRVSVATVKGAVIFCNFG